MTIKLKNITDIQMGFAFRSRVEISPKGQLAVLQMKDLLQDNTVADNLEKINAISMKDHHLAQKGDLIFRTRGQVLASAIINHKIDKTVISAPLLRIRITNPAILIPEYLNWFISQPSAQRFLKSRQEGTNVGMINAAHLENLKINLPSIENQKSIIELDNLLKKETKLLRKLTEKRRQYISRVLIQIAQDGADNG